MTLHNFLMHWVLAPSVAAVIAWALIKLMRPPLRVWKFVDRDLLVYYVCRSEQEARDIHVALYTEFDNRPAVFFCVGPVDPSFDLTIECAEPDGDPVTKSAYLWAKDHIGLIGSSDR